MVRGPWHLSFCITFFFSRFTIKQHSHKNLLTNYIEFIMLYLDDVKYLQENHKPSNAELAILCLRCIFFPWFFNSNLFNDRKLKGKYTHSVSQSPDFRYSPSIPKVLGQSHLQLFSSTIFNTHELWDGFPRWKSPYMRTGLHLYGGGGIALWLPSNGGRQNPRNSSFCWLLLLIGGARWLCSFNFFICKMQYKRNGKHATLDFSWDRQIRSHMMLLEIIDFKNMATKGKVGGDRLGTGVNKYNCYIQNR